MTISPNTDSPIDLAAAIAAGCTVIRSTDMPEGPRQTTVDGPAGRWVIDNDPRIWSQYRVSTPNNASAAFSTKDPAVALGAAIERAGVRI